jgi:aspartyl-tRNA synthetase
MAFPAPKVRRTTASTLGSERIAFRCVGLAWFKVESDKLVSPIEKFFPAAVQQALRQRLQAEPGDLLFFVADSEDIVCQSLCNLRTQLATTLELYDPSKPDYKLAWVVDFPMFTWDKEDNRWAANHHPFTAPRDEDLSRLETDPAAVQAQAYDLVINGDECGGGSIRIHNPEVQSQVFSVLGMTHRTGPAAIRLPTGRPEIRRPAARRHRSGA